MNPKRLAILRDQREKLRRIEREGLVNVVKEANYRNSRDIKGNIRTKEESPVVI